MIANDFMKLEKMEIGGIKGRNISRTIMEIFTDFQKLFTKWTNIQFDVLDPNPELKDFDREKAKFYADAELLERSLASQLAAAFDECHNAQQIIKLVQMTGALLSRPIILQDIEERYKMVVEYFSQDLDLVKYCFEDGMDKFAKNGVTGLPIDRGFPPVAGGITWIRRMKNRLESVSADFIFLDIP